MQVPPPGTLKLSKRELLKDVGQRLVALHPQFADLLNDPADPGWLLLEQAAWMAETLSEQLDQYPRHAMQHFLHLTGQSLLPASPSVGVVVVEAPEAGYLRLQDTPVPQARFFTPTIELQEGIEVVSIEPQAAPVAPARVSGICALPEKGELQSCGEPPPLIFPASHCVWLEPPQPLDLFRIEDLYFAFPRALKDRLQVLLARYAQENRPWMQLGLEGGETATEVWLRWRVGIPAAYGEYSASDENGLPSITFPWKELPFLQAGSVPRSGAQDPGADGPREPLEFRPQVKLRPEVQALGARLNLSRPGMLRVEVAREGGWLKGRPLAELITFPRPVPARMADQLYYTLFTAASEWEERPRYALPARTPVFRRISAEAMTRLPWLEPALMDRRWDAILEGPPVQLVHLELYGPAAPGARIRVGLLTPWSRKGEVLLPRAFFLSPPHAGRPRLLDSPSSDHALPPVWQFAWPSFEQPVSRGGSIARSEPVDLQVFEIVLPADQATQSIVLVVPQPVQTQEPLEPALRAEVAAQYVPERAPASSRSPLTRPIKAVLINPLLVANCPKVPDGRSIHLTSPVQETISLLMRPLVTRESLARLFKQPIHDALRARLDALPLAQLGLERTQKQLTDWTGIEVDPVEGTATFNTPTPEARALGLRRGDQILLHWYRRTDGQRGNAHTGAIHVVEQPPHVLLRIRGVHNPLPLVFGHDAETVDQGVERLFTPTAQSVPATASELEQWARLALPARPGGWVVRCWGPAERSMLACDWWISELGMGDYIDALLPQLQQAGPQGMLLVFGHPEGPLSALEFDRYRQQLLRAWVPLGARLPATRSLFVAPFVPLLHVSQKKGPIRVHANDPRFELKGLDGTLTDGQNSTPVPTSLWFFLNAGIVGSLGQKGTP